MLIFFLLLTTSFANTIICTHQQICDDLSSLNSNLNLKTTIELSIDKSVQKKAPYLVIAPHDLQNQNWDIIKQRETLGMRTLHLFLSSKYTKFYKQKGSTPIKEIAHYWLYPNLDCDIQNQLRNFLNELNHELPLMDCDLEQNKIVNMYQKLKKSGVKKISMTQAELSMLFNQDLFNVEVKPVNKQDTEVIEFTTQNNTIKRLSYNPKIERGSMIVANILKEFP
jgi:hypothetical protein